LLELTARVKGKTMQLCQFDDSRTFYGWTRDYLLQDEATHNLLLRLCHTLMHDRDRDPESYMAVVETNGTILAIALKTPQHPLILSKITDADALVMIAYSLYSSGQTLSAVSAPANESYRFAQCWQGLTGSSYNLSMALQVHQLDAVHLQQRSPGRLRGVKPDDRALLLQWHNDFSLEALGQVPDDGEHWFNHHLKQGTAYLWQNGETVTVACYGVTSPGAVAINMVYTPPKERKKGYASSCVAALSQWLLDQGNRCCFLFTDQAKATPNKIYRAIGFRPVSEWTNYSFKN
jgi:uncharacterized protein